MKWNQIGFVGAGKMAQALAAGIAKSHPETNFLIVDPTPAAQVSFRQRVAIGNQETGCASPSVVVASTHQVFEQCEIVFLAVKPQVAAEAMSGLSVQNAHSNLLVSVMAGITIAKIRELTSQRRIVRVMPNTPCLIGKGASAIACSDEVSEEEKNSVEDLFESIGIVERVEEAWLDAVTGLSGSGPAYVFTFIESLIRGGVAAGLPVNVAERLARQTVLGAASMLSELNASPQELRNQVTSPGGTTLAGLAELEQMGFERAVVQAVLSATARSQELGRS